MCFCAAVGGGPLAPVHVGKKQDVYEAHRRMKSPRTIENLDNVLCGAGVVCKVSIRMEQLVREVAQVFALS